jgi:hypothetical protein
MVLGVSEDVMKHLVQLTAPLPQRGHRVLKYVTLINVYLKSLLC